MMRGSDPLVDASRHDVLDSALTEVTLARAVPAGTRPPATQPHRRDSIMAPTKKTAFKATPATKRRSKSDLVKTIAAGTDLQAAKVKDVLEALTATMAADLGKKGCGEFNFNGLMKLKTVKKPATKARPGRNPFTGEAITIKAKPASRKVRVRALRGLNALI